jgi:DNA-binding beta-propeller fold protein YncE
VNRFLLFQVITALALTHASAQTPTLYLSDTDGNVIEKFDSAGNGSFFASSAIGPEGLAFDSSGYLYVVNEGDASGNHRNIERLSPTGADLGPVVTSGLTAPNGLAFDGNGDLYVSDFGTNTIEKFSAVGVHLGTFASGLASPRGIAFDSSGNLYVANFGDNTIAKIDPTGNRSLFASGLNGPHKLAFDSAGNLYVATYFDNGIQKLNPAGNATLFATAADHPYGLAFDQASNLYVALGQINEVEKFDPLGNGSAFAQTSGAFPNYIAVQPSALPMPARTRNAQIQAPINSDGMSVFTVKRGVVPVKFTLAENGLATCALPSATIAVTRTAGGATGPITESVYIMAADNGSNFRIDSCQYVYNLNSSGLGGGTYRVDIKINGQVVGSGIFKLNERLSLRPKIRKTG